MKFNLKNIKLSNNDIKNGVILPTKPSKELAEFLGILAGDGYVGHSKRKDHAILIAGHIKDDIPYLEYTKDLIKFLFNIQMKLYLREDINTAYLIKRSKGIIYFLDSIGYKKIHCIIKLPSWIWKNKKLTKYFIKGIFDTDGSICLKKNHGKYRFYPVINIKLKDGSLIKNLAKWTRAQNISFYTCCEKYLDKRTGKIYKRFSLQISGYKNVKKWVEIIGTSNLKQKEKMGKGGITLVKPNLKPILDPRL